MAAIPTAFSVVFATSLRSELDVCLDGEVVGYFVFDDEFVLYHQDGERPEPSSNLE